jgi:hypothetical protein
MGQTSVDDAEQQKAAASESPPVVLGKALFPPSFIFCDNYMF